MEYFYGLLTAVVFFIVYELGKHTGKKAPVTPVSEERKREMEQFDKHFKNLFTYDVDKAVQGKKVT
jgi:predicted polyphosphate/ATP-dependent NAD kinase